MIVLKSIILLFLALPVSAAAGSPPAVLDQECIEFISSIESKYDYGWADVAETPSYSNSIKIFYYYKKTSNLKNPVIFFNGGPGFTSHSSNQYLAPNPRRILL